MTISPASYLNYQNSANIKQNSKMHNSQFFKNQVTFRGLEKVVTTEVATETVKKNSRKILVTLTALGATMLSLLGIKTKKEKTLEKNFDAMLNTTMFSGLKKSDKNLYKEILKIYSDKPELVKDLITKNITYEHLDCNHDRITGCKPRYGCKDIITICEIDKNNQLLTPLAKKAFGGDYTKGYLGSKTTSEMREEVKNAILNEPEKVEKVMKELEKNKVFYDYSVWEDYYTVEAFLKALNEYDTK